ncbi:MAG: phosphohistidine phosphatase SixA [Kofleriaceae bacterium]|nr:phosphohistidine phosphatase SixA [Myxococcales bacterium]MCB9559817.1 phosphohistidine phosphatase SixA [Kofleriaceae bacterium]MCB9571428.1 phosphohistidine phosphatase SixA [Kofleriaceae bacterium]
MIVFLVRHGHAVDEAPGAPDHARYLTAEGRAAARALALRLSWIDCWPDRVWTSPLTRAIQTAELVVAGLSWGGVIEAVPALAPDGDVRGVAARIRELDAGAQVVVVGHEPALSGLGAVLTARPDFPALRKAQAARLDDVAALRQEGRGPMELQWTFGFADDAATPHV